MLIEATLIYVERGDDILMLHRVKKDNDIHKGKWNALGGKLEKGESPEECAHREMFEESGLTAEELNFVGHISFPNFTPDKDWSVFVFTCSKFHGELVESDEGELYWIKKDEILNLNLWEGDRIFIPKVLQKESFMAKFSYDNGQLQNYQIKPIK